jgi:lipid II isoglutaminyl synthase (glutamine-hydrolysing)
MKITVGYLYPEIMSTYGDRGNVETVIRRCGWRSIEVAVTELRMGDPVRPGEVDLIMVGGGGESQQRLIAADLYKVKGAAIREAVAEGTAALAVGGGYELFGRFCQPEQGAEFRGVEVFDCWTIRQTAILSDHYGTISQARADRVIGELIAAWDGRLLVGFENHSGGTYLGETAQPLARVITGHGNNGDGTEGVILGCAVGTNLRGPCLPKNPALADFLIGAALSRRYGAAELRPLADELEQAARELAVRRARQASQAARRGLARTVPGGSQRSRTGTASTPRLRRSAKARFGVRR